RGAGEVGLVSRGGRSREELPPTPPATPPLMPPLIPPAMLPETPCATPLATPFATPPATPLATPPATPPIGGFWPGRGAALRGNVNTASVVATAIQHEMAVNEAISLLWDIRTSFSISATRS